MRIFMARPIRITVLMVILILRHFFYLQINLRMIQYSCRKIDMKLPYVDRKEQMMNRILHRISPRLIALLSALIMLLPVLPAYAAGSDIDGDIDGQPMQVIAVRDSNGAVRLSYNTCQVCKGSPWAYFEVQSGRLVCQNCGNTFDFSSVGKGGYGCMPLMVPAYTLTETSVVIPHDTLVQVKDAFENWKVFP